MIGKKDRARRGERSSSAKTVGAGERHDSASRLPGAKPHARRPGDRAEAMALRRDWPLLASLATLAGVLLGALMIALSLLSVSAVGQAPIVVPSSTAQSAARPAPASPAPSGPERRAKGSPSAPVVITEWFDFQCPACRISALTLEPEIDRLYISTGKVRFIPRNMAFLGPESIMAAEAAEAAADQGRYWDFHAVLFQRQQGENLGAFRVENLKAFAAALGLDQRTFNDALDRGTHRAEVLAEVREGAALGVKSTPTYFINQRMVAGVPSVDNMKKMIDEELAKKQ